MKPNKLDFSLISELLDTKNKPFLLTPKGEKITLQYSQMEFGEFWEAPSVYIFKQDEVGRANSYKYLRLCDISKDFDSTDDFSIQDTLENIENAINDDENPKSESEIFADIESFLKEQNLEFFYFRFWEHSQIWATESDPADAHGIFYIDKERLESSVFYNGDLEKFKQSILNYLSEYIEGQRVDILVENENGKPEFYDYYDISIFEVESILEKEFGISGELEYHSTQPFFKAS